MSRFRAVLASTIALVFAVAACQERSQVVSPESEQVNAQVQGSGSAAPAASCDVTVPDDVSTIQDGVDAASSGETVCVKAGGGPYVEQVLINKDLTLQGIDDPTIQAPSTMAGFTLAESATSWEPVVFAFGGSESGGAVSGSATVDVGISGFQIDGGDQQPGADRLAGILFRNVQSGAEITENTVDGLANDGKRNFGVVVFGDSDVTISHNSVTGYERGGIFVTGGESGPAPTGRIRSNEVVADAPRSTGRWAPNGIQIGSGAQGEVVNNTVRDNVHPSAASGAVIVLETDGIKVRGNTATNNDYGVGVFTFFPAAPTADNNQIVRNDVMDARDWGVIVGTFTAETSAENNKVTNNTLAGDDGSTGVLIFGAASASNNKVINNTITGFDTDVADFGDNSKVQANTKPSTP